MSEEENELSRAAAMNSKAVARMIGVLVKEVTRNDGAALARVWGDLQEIAKLPDPKEKEWARQMLWQAADSAGMKPNPF